MMATDSMSVTVSMEAAIHRAVRKVFQEIADEHGILIENVEVQWISLASYADSEKAEASTITMRTRSNK